VSARRRSARRVALLGAAAFLAYGSWAAFANRAHGADAALRAFVVQGCSSAFVTSTIAAVIEWAHARLPRTRASALLAVSFGALFATAFHCGLHLVMGTPELLRTVAVPVLASVVYASGYVTTLRALAGGHPRRMRGSSAA
jgi:peptidoglycan/LPS O-acetylase OafA/YrhL